MIKTVNDPDLVRICQGDIISNVEYIEYALQSGTQIEISKIVFPYVYVLTQDCDLEQEHNNRNNTERKNQDKYLLSVIVAPIYTLEHVCNGEHLSELGLTMCQINPKLTASDNKYLRQNNNPRYHFLEFPESVSITDSVIDFKHYFTVNSQILLTVKKDNFVCKLDTLYRELVSQRFANYLSRIGLPNN